MQTLSNRILEWHESTISFFGTHAILEPHFVTSFIDVSKSIRVRKFSSTTEMHSAILDTSNSKEWHRLALFHLGHNDAPFS